MGRGGQRILLTTTATREVVELFTTVFGYRHEAVPDLAQPADQLRDRLGSFAGADQVAPEDHLVLYVAARADLSEDSGLVLRPPGTDGEAAAGEETAAGAGGETAPAAAPGNTAERRVPASLLARWLITASPVRCPVLILDLSCDTEAIAAAARYEVSRKWRERPAELPPDDPGAGLVVVLATNLPDREPNGFGSALADAARHPASGGNIPPYLRIATLARLAGAATCRVFGVAEEPDGLLPNPRHDPALAAAPARAAPPFTGRQRALTDLARWLTSGRAEDAGRSRVVTGLPGSGKTAVLTLLADVSDPARHRTVLPADLPAAVAAVADHIDDSNDARA